MRDYLVAGGGSGRLGTSSPFNIKVESITLLDFTREEVAELYAQHTEETGQVFLPAAVDRAWELSRGQPWLVNALANPIYREVVARVLIETPRASLPRIAPTWLLPDGRMDVSALLDTFLAFWRRHGEALQGAAPYREVAPQLVMMAFLDRVANGGGQIEREYAIGSGRIDLCLRWRDRVFAFELKTWRAGAPDPLADGLEQLDRYLEGLGLDSGWLVIFDQRPERGTVHAERASTPGGREVTVVRA